MIRAALHAYAATRNREWQQDRSQTVGASEIGQCARKIYFTKNEGDRDFGSARDEDHEDGWGARVRGSVYESSWWEPALREHYGPNLLYAGQEQRTFASGFLSATPDGLVVQDDGCFLVECKTADPRTNLTEAKPEHVFQVQAQLGLVRERTNYQPEHAVISYTDTSFWDEIKEFRVAFDPKVFAQAQARATEIMTATSAGALRPEGYIAGGRECAYCPFAGPCGVIRASAVPKDDGVINGAAGDQIAALASRAKASRAKAEILIDDAKALEQDIKDALAQAGSRKAAGDADGVTITVSWAALKGRPSWDMKRLREAAAAAGIDLSQFETAGDPSDRLVIKEKSK